MIPNTIVCVGSGGVATVDTILHSLSGTRVQQVTPSFDVDVAGSEESEGVARDDTFQH